MLGSERGEMYEVNRVTWTGSPTSHKTKKDLRHVPRYVGNIYDRSS